MGEGKLSPNEKMYNLNIIKSLISLNAYLRDSCNFSDYITKKNSKKIISNIKILICSNF